jgi:hypothetical protein
MPDIETLVFSRRDEVRRLIAEKRQELSVLEDELGRIDAIIESQNLSAPPIPVARDTARPTIKQMILAVLAENPDGLRLKDLHAAVEARFSTTVIEKSMTPQVMRLRDELKIMKTPQGLWVLAPSSAEPST